MEQCIMWRAGSGRTMSVPGTRIWRLGYWTQLRAKERRGTSGDTSDSGKRHNPMGAMAAARDDASKGTVRRGTVSSTLRRNGQHSMHRLNLQMRMSGSRGILRG